MKNTLLLLLCCGLMGVAKAQSQIEHTITWSPGVGLYAYTHPEDSWYDDVDVFMGVKLDYGLGYRISDKLTLGGTVGLRHFMIPDYIEINADTDMWTSGDDIFQSFFKLPVAANIKIRFTEKRVSPYAGVSAGYMFTLGKESFSPLSQNSMFGNAQAGVSINFKNYKSLYVGPIVEIMSSQNNRSGYDMTNMWQFGLNVSFAF